ncbi:6725_t:CDS:10 [Ambispora gerdemannii]|uniref:6725_t:CDS:1 n=1 Tax=Ambispora gerdemannii TaxID=144530 RepID=A0A9N8V1L7_9GLOM|nr:6725_t:CDS:10 [Ambispora gerdemannii]
MFVDFLHCNLCFGYSTPSSSSNNNEDKLRFWLTECGHMICQACYNKSSEPSTDNSNASNSKDSKERACPVCQAKSTVVELTDKLPNNLNIYFRPPNELLDEAADALRFQHSNLYGLLNFLKDKVNKQKQVLDKAKEELIKHKEIKNQLQALKEENKRLKAELQEARTGGINISAESKEPSSTSKETPYYSPRSLESSSSIKNRNGPYISPKQSRLPKTPNPPSRLSLPSSSTCSISPAQPSSMMWNNGVGEYQGFDGGGAAVDVQGPNINSLALQNQVLSTPARYNQTYVASTPLNNSHLERFNQSEYSRNLFSQQTSGPPPTTFSRPGTSARTRMSWNSLHGSGRGGGVGGVGTSGRPSTARINTLAPRLTTPSFAAVPSTPMNSSGQYQYPSNSEQQQSMLGPGPPPRTPMTRNRNALPGFMNGDGQQQWR